MSNKPGTILFIGAILITWLFIHLESTPVPVSSSMSDANFSVPRANLYLRQIAQAPHSLGTPEDARVRDTIVAICQRLGLSTQIQHTTSLVTWGRGAVTGNIYNIIAKLKGKDSGKAVAIVAHYDSQPNTPGAGDDGANCAAMLEVARILKAGSPLKNDILFLFTDGEEEGLLGAAGFVQDSSWRDKVGIVLNFEGRGSSGVSNMFETNPENGWSITEYARSGAHLNANSLSYELYKILPNNTDYTIFKQAGIAGLNHAYIDRFVDYHSMTDRPENFDQDTYQEQGDNMLSLAWHFGNADLSETKAPDITYFSFFGHWMIRYPAGWNQWLLVLANLLLVAVWVAGIVRKKIRGWGIVVGILLFPLLLVLLYFLNSWMLRGILTAYPLYNHFYAGNSYNAAYYFFALTAISLAVFIIPYQLLLRRFKPYAMVAGMLLWEVAFVDLLYTVIPTAIYFLCLPLLFAQVAYLLYCLREDKGKGLGWGEGILMLLLLLPAILLLAPVITFTYVALGLSEQSAFIVVLTGLLLGLFLPLITAAIKESRWLIPAGAVAAGLVTLVLAHVYSRYTPTQPFKADLSYQVNADEGKAYWVSEYKETDPWSRQFFPHARVGPVYQGGDDYTISDAPLLSLQAPVLTIRKDTTDGEIRKLTLHYEAGPGAVSASLYLDKPDTAIDLSADGRKPIFIDGGKVRGYRWLEYYGIPGKGFDVQFDLPAGKALKVEAITRWMELPEQAGFKGYPADVIPGPGDNSNSTQVAKHFIFP